jgi:hypothetical protein
MKCRRHAGLYNHRSRSRNVEFLFAQMREVFLIMRRIEVVVALVTAVANRQLIQIIGVQQSLQALAKRPGHMAPGAAQQSN